MELAIKSNEAASLMGVTARHVRRMVEQGKIGAFQMRNTNNLPEYKIPLSSLPADAQKRYYDRHGVEELRPTTASAAPAARSVESYSAAEREEIAFWEELLERWQYYRARGGTVSKAEMDARFVAQCRLEYPERAMSVDILYRKQRALREGDADGLLDRRGTARAGKTVLPDEIVSAFFTVYLTQSKLSVPRCMTAVRQWAQKNMPDALPLPGYSTFYRKAMELPLPVRILCREGPKAYYDKCSPYTQRQYECLGANDWWVGDTYTCDVMTRGPDGSLHRPYLSAWVDVRSGIFVGWHIAFTSSSQNTVYALGKGAKKHGIPNHNCYTDNGREYLTFDIGGRGHRAKKVLADGSEPFAPPGIFQRMEVGMVNAIVCNARAKLVERSFEDVKNYIMKLFPSYTGGHIKEKPERLKQVLKTDAVPTDAEFITKVDELIEHYLNYEPYYGSVDEDKGKRRIDVFFERRLKTRKPTPEALHLMLLRTSRPVTVQRNGIEIDVRGGAKAQFYCEELCNRMQGKKVYARYDPDDLRSVRVYDEDDRFLVEVPRSTLELPYGATQEDIANGERKKRHAKKALTEFIQTLVLEDGTIDPLALMMDLAASNKEDPARDPGCKEIYLEYPEEKPLLQAVGGLDIAAINQRFLKENGGFDDE